MTLADLSDRRSWSDPAAAADGMLRQALSACTERIQAESLEACREQLRRGDPATWSLYEYALAQRVGEYLETCDDYVKAVYIYGNDGKPEDGQWEETGLAPLIHLIVWAQPKTAALRALIDILNRALARRLGRIVGTFSVTQLLDVQVVDDQDVSRRAGYASLLTSSQYRPAQVWKRQAATV